MTIVNIEAANSGNDDSARINSALSDPAVTTVILGEGTFYASASIIVPSGKTLIGYDTDSTMIVALPDFARDAGSFGVVASATGATNVTIANLSIDANKLLVDGARLNGCFMDQATAFTVNGVNVYNATGYGHFAQGDLNSFVANRPDPIYASGTYNDCWAFNTNVAFEQMFSDGITLTNCHARDGDGDIHTEYHFHPLSGSKNITYEDCTSVGAVHGGFGLVSNIAPLENISIINCTAEVGAAPAITSAGANPVIGLEIVGSSFVSYQNAGARLGGVSGTIEGSYFQGQVIGAEFGYSTDGTACSIAVADTYAIGISSPWSPAASYAVNVFGNGITWEGGKLEAWGAAGLMYPISGPLQVSADTELVKNGYHGPASPSGGFVVGTDAGNQLIGDAGINSLLGLGGDDILDGHAGPDVMQGGAGNDSYFLDNALDIPWEDADEGFDAAYSNVDFKLTDGSHIELLGTVDWRLTTPLRLTGNALNNKVVGNNGHNQLYGGAGDDSLLGLAGNDILDGGLGRDIMQGGLGDDRYFVDNALDVVHEAADEGYDIVYTSVNFALQAGSHVELIGTTDWKATSPLRLSGNELHNKVVGNNGHNQLYGGAGNDTLLGLDGDDLIDGGSGDDILIGGTGNDSYFVTSGDQVVEEAGEGFDAVYASESFSLSQGSSVELLGTTNASHVISINLTGNNLNNSVIGNAGANIINGGDGHDTLRGMGGNDRFDFTTTLGPNNIDLLPDFAVGEDLIGLGRKIFTTLQLGQLDPDAFAVGPIASDANDRIIYDSKSGALFYDADGSGAGTAIQFATLNPGLSLSHSDFLVI